MRFSIVIPVYNVNPFLPDCMDGIVRQSYTDWEAICVNDGSTDGSGETLSKYSACDKRFHIITQTNKGLSSARNTGLDAATGDYVLFVDSDDWVEPTMLSALAENINGEDMVCFACRRTDKNNADTLVPEETTGWDYYNRHALEHWETPFVCVVQRCYRRQFLEDNGLRFREGILHEDNEFTPRASLAAKHVKVIPDVLYNYRVRSGSIMTTRGLRSKESLILIANNLTKHFSAIDGIDKTTIYRALTQYYQMAFVDNTREEDRHLRPLVDWKAYRQVSRTKLRHRLKFLRNKYCR